MRRKDYIALILWIASFFLFAIGMCSVLAPEFGSFNFGIAMGISGLVLALTTLIIWRKLSGKKSLKLSIQQVSAFIAGTIGILVFGVGMCFSMLWDEISAGIVISLAGIAILLSLIPILKGIKE